MSHSMHQYEVLMVWQWSTTLIYSRVDLEPFIQISPLCASLSCEIKYRLWRADKINKRPRMSAKLDSTAIPWFFQFCGVSVTNRPRDDLRRNGLQKRMNHCSKKQIRDQRQNSRGINWRIHSRIDQCIWSTSLVSRILIFINSAHRGKGDFLFDV